MYETEYLEHHGVKGMKWGVRRYRYSNGKLTPKGKKHLKKLENYRDKKTSKAERNRVYYNAKSRKAGDDLKDLNKYGTRSNTWKQYVQDRRDSRKINHDFVYGKGSYMSSGKAFWDELGDAFTVTEDFKNYKKELLEDQKSYRNKGREWATRKKNLLDMPITIETTKRDIRKTFKGQ